MIDKENIKESQFKVRLSKEDKEKLNKLSKYYGLSKSELFRKLINEEHTYLALKNADYIT